MPTISSDNLKKLGIAMFVAAGCTEDESELVVDHLVESSLFGHDSHGALRFYDYCGGIREGRYRIGGTPEIVRESVCSAVVDGGQCLGQVGAHFATGVALEKAKQHGVGIVTLRNTSHIGRVGAYPLRAAREGFIAQIYANAGRAGFEIAPFGGIDGKLTSDPLAFAAPRKDAPPIMLDMTTSMAAVGKIWMAENRGEALPEGWIIDHEGNPSTDPKDFTGEPKGAMLPLGGSAGYKGYGLSLMVELLGGALSGQGCAAGEQVCRSNGVAIVAYNIEHFVDLEDYYRDVEVMIEHVKSSRPAVGCKEVLLPGEMEFTTARRRKKEGIDLDETTWAKICEQASTIGVDAHGMAEIN